MSAEYIRNIEKLASQFEDRSVTLYFPDFETEPPADCLNQVYGAPVGVRADNWPIYRGLPALLRQASGRDEDSEITDLRMEHLWTIDLRGLTGLGTPAQARALQLYVSNAAYHEAWTAGTPHTRVVVLGEADLAAGRFTGEIPERSKDHTVKRFTLVPVTVPAAVFGKREEGTPLAALHEAIWKAPARIGGEPIWLQGDPDEQDDFGGYDEDEDEDGESDGDSDDEDGDGESAAPAAPAPLGLPGFGWFIVQFDESFADVNLGDCGVMYVTGDDAHFQCY